MNNFQIPFQMINMLKNGSPQQIAMNLLQNNAKGNPFLENILNMANSGDMNSVEQICKNIIKSKGYNPDELMNMFKNQL